MSFMLVLCFYFLCFFGGASVSYGLGTGTVLKVLLQRWHWNKTIPNTMNDRGTVVRGGDNGSLVVEGGVCVWGGD